MRSPNNNTRGRVCILVAIILAACTLLAVDAFSSSGPLVVTRGGRNCVTASAVRNEADMSGLFPGDGPYVPVGLSAEEYQRIKSDEEKKLKKMEFGAWGPRFKRTDTPDGDWMVMSKLWTNGSPNARPGPRLVQEGNDDYGINAFAASLPRRTTMLIRQNGPGFVLAFFLLELVASAFTMYRTSEGAVRKSIWTVLKYGLLKKKNFYVLTMAQTLAAKFTLSACLTRPVMNVFLEKMNRRKLWSRRRTILTTSGTGMLALTAWAAMLVLSVR
jgi:hypothetical protein